MNPYALLEQAVSLLRQGLDGVTVCQAYPSERARLPLASALLTLDMQSGGEAKTELLLTAYQPASAEACRALTEQARALLAGAGLSEYRGLTAKAVEYDKAARAFVQEAVLLFEAAQGAAETVLLTFGDESITGDAQIVFSRRIQLYYSPIAGAQAQDLGVNLRQMKGTAKLTAAQFARLVALAKSGEVRTAALGGESFPAVLSELSGRPDGKTAFVLTEVPA